MKRLTALKKIGNKMPRKGRLSVYLSFIRPILEFGFQLYDGCTKTHLEKLENVQRQSLLYATRAYKKTSHKELLKETGVPLLESRRRSQKIQFIYKAKHDKIPYYFQAIIPHRQSNIHTRNFDTIARPKTTKNYCLKSFISTSIKEWNDTDIDVRTANSLHSLKAKLKDIHGSSSYHLYLAEDGNGAVQHSRIRMG